MSKIAYVVSAIHKVLFFCDSQSRLLNAQISTLLNPPTTPIYSFTGSAMLFLKLAFVLSICLLNFILKAQN